MVPMVLKFEISHLSTKFQHPMFNRSEIIVLTNNQRDSVENIHLAPLWRMKTKIGSDMPYGHLIGHVSYIRLVNEAMSCRGQGRGHKCKVEAEARFLEQKSE